MCHTVEIEYTRSKELFCNELFTKYLNQVNELFTKNLNQVSQ